MADKEVNIFIRAKDEASSAIKSMTDRIIFALNPIELLQKGFELLKDAVSESVGAAIEQQNVLTQMSAALKSTGNAVGLTKNEIVEYAETLSKSTGIADEVIESGQNMLLTFTNVRGEGFKKATEAILDMDYAMTKGNVTSESLRQTTIQVGKALQDPINGMTALHRVGVEFTEQQKEQIKTLQISGDTVGAQNIILKELQKEFGNSAKAGAETFGGSLKKLNVNIDETAESIGTSLLPGLKSVVDGANNAFKAFSNLPSPLKTIISVAGMVTAGLAALSGGLYAARLAIGAFRIAIVALAGSTGIGALILALGVVVGSIVALRDHFDKTSGSLEKFKKTVGGMNTDQLNSELEKTKKKLSEINDKLNEMNKTTMGRVNLEKDALLKQQADLKEHVKIISGTISDRAKQEESARKARVASEAAANSSVEKSSKSALENLRAQMDLHLSEISKKRKVNTQDEINELQKILASDKLTSEERIQVRTDLNNAIGKKRDEDTQAEKKANNDRIEAAKKYFEGHQQELKENAEQEDAARKEEEDKEKEHLKKMSDYGKQFVTDWRGAMKGMLDDAFSAPG